MLCVTWITGQDQVDMVYRYTRPYGHFYVSPNMSHPPGLALNIRGLFSRSGLFFTTHGPESRKKKMEGVSQLLALHKPPPIPPTLMVNF